MAEFNYAHFCKFIVHIANFPDEGDNRVTQILKSALSNKVADF